MVQEDRAAESRECEREQRPSAGPAVAGGDAHATARTDCAGHETAGRNKFLSGVVEGFYGRPWTMEQRKELFRRQQKWGLNTYLYAPKDNYKHRMFWRELYSVEEAEQLMTLISSAKEHGIEFIYAISPGLDMVFSSQKEVSTLKQKLDQVSHFGCRSFALLFDDIDHNMCLADKEVFSSFAHAQVSITNEIFQYLGGPQTFLFCPTEYCGTLCYPSVLQSPYLRTVGEKLLPGIQVLWAGPKVVSKDITVESIEEVSKILKRAPVIWDNFHADDYDQKRLFLGPYKGRSTELIPRLKGVLTNPNCEFEANFIPIHTLATWYKSNMNGVRKDAVTTDSEDSAVSIQIKLENEGGEEELEKDMLYSPQQALKLALSEWLAKFGVPHQYSGYKLPHCNAKSVSGHMAALAPSLCPTTIVTTVLRQPIMSPGTTPSQEVPKERKEFEEEPMEMVEKQEEDNIKDSEPFAMETAQERMVMEAGPLHKDMDREGDGEREVSLAVMQTDMQSRSGEMALYEAESPTLDDLRLLIDIFYLPYEHGPKAANMLREFNWLRANSSVVSVNSKGKDPDKVAEWRSRAKQFEDMCSSVIQMFTRVSSCANRTILYDLYPYIWDIKSIICLVKSFVQWLDGRILSTSFYCYWIDNGQWYRSQSSAQFLNGDQEAWAFRGGLAGEFQRLLPIDGAHDLFFQPPPPIPTSKMYSIRPYLPKDEAAVYRICREVYGGGPDGFPILEQELDLIGDRLVGGFLTLSPDYGFVLEDEEGICGYALGTIHVKHFAKKCKMCWIPTMQEKYRKPDCEKELSEAERMMLSFHEEEGDMPDSFLSNFPSLIKIDIHGKVTDPSVAKSMMGCLLSSLKANGSRGAFCEVRQTDRRKLDFYTQLGCFEVTRMDGFPKGVIILGRNL